jgi:DNA ligase D-like protein (predicted ligase)
MNAITMKDIDPMLISENKEAFNSEDYIFEIKWDGIRGLAYLNENTDIRSRNNRYILHQFPELSNLHNQVNKKCILDGELVVLKNSQPDFSEMKKRVNLTNQSKIQIAVDKSPVMFIAFDILYYQDHEIMNLPLIERKKYLEDVLQENNRIVFSRFVETEGVALYELVEEKKLEGVVAKRKSSLYWPGKRTSDWVKIKKMVIDNFVVCGYVIRSGKISLILGQYKENKLIYRGRVSSGVTKKKFFRNELVNTEKPAFGYVPRGCEDATWLYPNLICMVESMFTEEESLRQPVLKNIKNM